MRRRTRREFEANDVYKRNELKKIRNTGYDAFRVSPRTTELFGKKYRKIYGATIDIDWTRGKPGKHGSKVSWYQHYYTTEKIKPGTRLLSSFKTYPVDPKELRYKLMLRKRKRK